MSEEKKYFGLKKDKTCWSYSHGQPLWLVDLQKVFFLSIPIGIAAAVFTIVTGLSMFWFLVPTWLVISLLFFRG